MPYLKIINNYDLQQHYLVETEIIDKRKNETKRIDYLGGKIIRTQIGKIKHKSIADSYVRDERFYADCDVFESQTIVKKKGWLKREKTTTIRQYINGTLKYERIVIK